MLIHHWTEPLHVWLASHHWLGRNLCQAIIRLLRRPRVAGKPSTAALRDAALKERATLFVEDHPSVCAQKLQHIDLRQVVVTWKHH